MCICVFHCWLGKVEMITGVGKAMDPSLSQWGNSNRPIVASGIFGHYLVTPADEALFVVNGETRTVNCEIGGLMHPRIVVWVTMQLQWTNKWGKKKLETRAYFQWISVRGIFQIFSLCQWFSFGCFLLRCQVNAAMWMITSNFICIFRRHRSMYTIYMYIFLMRTDDFIICMQI